MVGSAAAIFSARNLAIVGASDTTHWPVNIHANLKESGFPGRVFLINPRRTEIFGEKCYPDFAALPEPAELALMIVPAKLIPDLLASGARTGVKAAIVYAAGMGEGSDPQSHALGARLKSVLDSTGIAACGPNCMGLVGIRQKLYLYPHAHMRNLPAGPVGMVLQSGGTLSFFVRSARERGLEFSYAISSGNEVGLDLSDYVDFLVDDPGTKQIALMIEGIRKPQAFMAAAARALAAGKPIIAIKAGRSAASREGARTHSGAIAGDYAAWRAVCERFGIVNCETLEEMIETLLAFQQGRLPKGPRMAFVTTSGGAVNLLHDYIEAEGAVAPPLSPQTVERVSAIVAPGVPVKSPIDTGPPLGPNGPKVPLMVCREFAADPVYDMVGWAVAVPGTERGGGDPDGVKAMLAGTDKPIVAFGRMPNAVNQAGRDWQRDTNLWVLQGMKAAVRAMNALWFYGARAGRRVPPLPPAKGRAVDTHGEKLAAALAARGIAGPKQVLARTADEAAAAAARIGFPVALKIVSPQVLHKTEAGGVQLGLRDAAAVEAAAKAMVDAVRRHDAKAEISGFLVQEMVEGVEMIIGAHDDPLYGPVLLVGAGGVLVELVRDSALSLLPADTDGARTMIGVLRASTLLQGFRGKKPADIEALVRAAVALGDFFLDHRDHLAEIEINPLVVLPQGQGVRAVDIRAVGRTGS